MKVSGAVAMADDPEHAFGLKPDVHPEDDIVMRVGELISHELSLHKQGLDWTDQDGPIYRTAKEVIEYLNAP